MAFRKNTAQAFEILRQIHAEEKLRGESARSPVSESEPKPQSGPMQAPGTREGFEEAASAEARPPVAPPVAKRAARIGRGPLLKAERSRLDERVASRRRESISMEQLDEPPRDPVPQPFVPMDGAPGAVNRAAERGDRARGPADQAHGRRESSSLHRWLDDQKEAHHEGAERDAARERRALLATSFGERAAFVRKPPVDPAVVRTVEQKREEHEHRPEGGSVGLLTLLTPTEPRGVRPLEDDSPEEGGSGNGPSPEPQAQAGSGATGRGSSGRDGSSGRSGSGRPSRPSTADSRRGPGRGKDSRRKSSATGRSVAPLPPQDAPLPPQDEGAPPPNPGHGLEAKASALRESASETAVVVASPGVPGELRKLGGRVRTAVGWALGDGGSRWLGRRVELKVSSLLALALVGAVVVTLLLMWLQLPGETDPHFAAAPAGWTSSSAGWPSSATDAPALPADGLEPDSRLRPVPGDAHGLAPVAGKGSPPEASIPVSPSPADASGRPADAPGVAVVPAAAVALDWSSAPGPALAPSVGETAALQLAPVAPPVPAPIYRIQVRARESWAGADKLLAYLKGFGFRETLREEDGSRGGETLYTVFVGNYSTLKEARRECGRLIERTHKTPYKDKPDYFQDCFALRRPR